MKNKFFIARDYNQSFLENQYETHKPRHRNSNTFLMRSSKTMVCAPDYGSLRMESIFSLMTKLNLIKWNSKRFWPDASKRKRHTGHFIGKLTIILPQRDKTLDRTQADPFTGPTTENYPKQVKPNSTNISNTKHHMRQNQKTNINNHYKNRILKISSLHSYWILVYSPEVLRKRLSILPTCYTGTYVDYLLIFPVNLRMFPRNSLFGYSFSLLWKDEHYY